MEFICLAFCKYLLTAFLGLDLSWAALGQALGIPQVGGKEPDTDVANPTCQAAEGTVGGASREV